MRKLLPLLLLLVILTPLYPVYAQTYATTSSPDTMEGALPPRNPLKNATGTANLKPGLGARLEPKGASRSAELKAKLAKFRNKIKADRIEKINTHLNEINTRRTQNMQETLTKLSEILDKLKSKATALSSTEVDSAISDVQSQWDEANAAVEAQVAKDYSITLNTENTAASDAAAARNALQSDLMATHSQVIDVRQSLANAISSVLSSLGGTNGSN